MMSGHGLARVGFLALMFGLVTFHSADADEFMDAQKAVLGLVKDAKGGKVDGAKLKALRKKHDDLLHIMTIYKPTTRKGLGYEQQLIKLGGRGTPAKMVLENDKDKLIEMAEVLALLGDLTKEYAPTAVKGGKGPKDWNKYAEDQTASAHEFLKAVKAADPVAVKKASEAINAACNNCHSDFRDK